MALLKVSNRQILLPVSTFNDKIEMSFLLSKTTIVKEQEIKHA